MWSFGNSVREIENSHGHVIIEEAAATGAAWLFGGLALLVLALWGTGPRSSKLDLPDEAIPAFAVVYFATFAVWASVRSTFTADRRGGQLIRSVIMYWLVKVIIVVQHKREPA